MNKEYALQILDSIECGTLEPDCSLAKEAFRYLEKLKTIKTDVLDRIYAIRHKTRRAF